MPDLPLHSLPQRGRMRARSPCGPRAATRPHARCFFGLAVLLVGAGTVQAQVSATSDYLRRMDANGDGGVALVEYQDWMSYAFDRMDANADGVLQPHERPGGRGKPVDRSEYRARIARTFSRQDSNRDGVLDARELAAAPL